MVANFKGGNAEIPVVSSRGADSFTTPHQRLMSVYRSLVCAPETLSRPHSTISLDVFFRLLLQRRLSLLAIGQVHILSTRFERWQISAGKDTRSVDPTLRTCQPKLHTAGNFPLWLAFLDWSWFQKRKRRKLSFQPFALPERNFC